MALDEQGLVDLSTLEKRDYNRLFLKFNPFPSTAVPAESPITTADRKPVLRRFLDVLSGLYSDGTSSITVLLGDYGTGKSHLLKLFKVSINSKLLHSDKPIIAIYIKSPGRNIRDLLLYLIDDIGRDFLVNLASKYIFNFIKSDSKKYLIHGRKFILESASQITNYMLEAKTIQLINDLEDSLSNVQNTDLIRAFLALPDSNLGSIAWRWFVGSSLSREERDRLHLESIINDTRIAEQVLNGLLKLLISMGICGIVLLIDELERITLIPGIAKGLYQDALRHVIDNNPSDLVMIYAITPTEWNKLTESPSALERRLAGSVIDLPPFSKADVHELIEKYLTIARIKIMQQKIPKLFPFSEESIETIFSATKGIPSKIILLCRLCVDKFAVSESVEKINSDFIKKVIQGEGFQ